MRRLRLVLIGLVVVPVACSDAADGLVDKAVGNWHCEDDPQERSEGGSPHIDVTVERDTFTVHDTGRPERAVGWELDGGRLVIDIANGRGERIAVEGVEEGAERLDLVGWDPEQTGRVAVEAVSDDEVRFREDAPGTTTWTCRRR